MEEFHRNQKAKFLGKSALASAAAGDVTKWMTSLKLTGLQKELAETTKKKLEKASVAIQPVERQHLDNLIIECGMSAKLATAMTHTSMVKSFAVAIALTEWLCHRTLRH